MKKEIRKKNWTEKFEQNEYFLEIVFQEAKVQFVEKLETTTSGEVGKDIRLKVKLSNAGNYQKLQLFFAGLDIFYPL